MDRANVLVVVRAAAFLVGARVRPGPGLFAERDDGRGALSELLQVIIKKICCPFDFALLPACCSFFLAVFG